MLVGMERRAAIETVLTDQSQPEYPEAIGIATLTMMPRDFECKAISKRMATKGYALALE